MQSWAGQILTEFVATAQDAGGRVLRALLSLLGLMDGAPSEERWTSELAVDASRVLKVQWDPAEGWSASAGKVESAEHPLTRAWSNIGRIEGVTIGETGGVSIGKMGHSKRGS